LFGAVHGVVAPGLDEERRVVTVAEVARRLDSLIERAARP